MSCNLTTGFLNECLEGMGGVTEFFFGNFVSDFSATQDTTGRVTAISGTGLSYYKYELPQENGNVVENIQSDDTAGSNYVEQTLNLVMNSMTQAKRNEIKLLSKAKLTVIVKDNNGDYRLYGLERGVRTTPGGSATTGTAAADRNGYNLTFIAREPELAPIVDYSAFSALIA